MRAFADGHAAEVALICVLSLSLIKQSFVDRLSTCPVHGHTYVGEVGLFAAMEIVTVHLLATDVDSSSFRTTWMLFP